MLWWTHFAIAIAVIGAMITGLVTLTDPQRESGLGRHLLLLPILLWAGLVWFQTVSMSPSIVGMLSPASAEAYTDWINPFLDPVDRPDSFPISISPTDTYHVFAMILVIAGLAWVAAETLQTRARIGWLLCAVSICGIVTVTAGFWRIMSPDSFPMKGVFTAEGAGFGSFVNRNNAALTLNLGLAASLGLLSWRLAALTGQEVDDPTFEFNDLISLISDRESAVGIFGAVGCVTGLLICGSRGGLAAALVGALLAFGWVRQRRGFISIPVVGAVIALAAALLIVPLNLDLASLQRFEFGDKVDTSTLLRDGRFQHWPDAWTTAKAHFPAGAGTASYAFAYLPHQETTNYTWFHHADNLWLELIVEQGLGGVLLTLLTLFLVIRSLMQLGESHDAIDQGLRMAGWFAFGAIVVSQFFDYGLIVPVNLIITTILFAAVIAREVSLRASEAEQGRIVFRKRRNLVLALIIPLLVGGAVVYSIPILQNDANVEYTTRLAKAKLNFIKGDPRELRLQVETLQQHSNVARSPHILDQLSQTLVAQARLEEVTAARPESEDEIVDLYRGTEPHIRRLQWRQDEAGSVMATPVSTSLPEGSAFHYQQALEQSVRTLLVCPLDPEARVKQIYLDFVHQDRELTRTALQQLRQFYGNNPIELIKLGTFAADSEELDVAIDAWRSAISTQPKFTSQAIQLANARQEIDFRDVLPDQPVNYRAAARHLIDKGLAIEDFLKESQQKIACDTCEFLAERARCEELAGDIAFALNEFPEAFAAYRKGIEFVPTNPNLRLKLINRMRAQGNEEWRVEARKARRVMPTDDRFDKLIKKYAQEEIDAIERPNN